MIYDKIENLKNYENIHPRFKRAFAYLMQLIAENAADGKYEMSNCDVDGAVFANVSSYNRSTIACFNLVCLTKFLMAQLYHRNCAVLP